MGWNTFSNCGTCIMLACARAHAALWGPEQLLNHKSRLRCESWCIMLEGERNHLPESRGPSGGYVTCVINTANAKPSSKEGYTVMEFVPSVQNITEVLNRGPSMDGRVLSPANTVGLPPRGQASERVNIAFTSKQRGGWSALRETWLFG